MMKSERNFALYGILCLYYSFAVHKVIFWYSILTPKNGISERNQRFNVSLTLCRKRFPRVFPLRKAFHLLQKLNSASGELSKRGIFNFGGEALSAINFIWA